MGVSAGDIITYIGIPLAVLGVLPTIYTCAKSFITLREITNTLRRNGVTAITRSALLTGIVEIEIPRRSIMPLERRDPKYFGLNAVPSRLKGGSWTMFNWKEMVIGVKSYRLQYHDELSQPQAETDFEALIAFLLDRGAVPSKEGWSNLRGAGLWTPAGTKLLLSPLSAEAVLSVAMSDDSDGILSLALNWKREWDSRDAHSLPPYWTRVRSAPKEGDLLAALAEVEKPPLQEKGPLSDHESVASEPADIPSAIRMRISATGIEEAYNEDDVKHALPLLHLRSLHASPESTQSFWFCCAATACEAPKGGLWSFSIPEDIVSISRRDTIPCGVMVLLGTMTDNEVPAWRTPHDAKSDQFEKHAKFMEQSRRLNEEARLPPHEREAARQKRVREEAMDFHNEVRRSLFRDEQRREAQVLEAMQSQKLPIAVVAEVNRKWVLQRFSLPSDMTILALAEQILYAMVVDESFARRIAAMLDLWKSWGSSGGMTKTHYLAAKEDQVTFSLASFVFYMIRSTVSEPMGCVAGDLQECLRIWKKVRLG
ncbi:hypothetical protein FB567DRAFT_251472 [Paraphoma chrysanthemicola]|uniref:Uncharacterized protein n=1 Tax=Paraphoma chrysanthemicola TaxID=798071 RepID=A0A8K0QS74_9PLEO|nr:hypothetical protein FB567DRAFT_251472 [Paraphoma chrysanthemicola]